MNLLGPAFSLYLRRYDRWLDQQARDPVGCQQRTLASLLHAARETALGRELDFRSIQTPADFARAVPIRDYVALLPYVERMLAGEADVTWPGAVKYFAQTSGTTAGDKRIPVTAAMQKSNAQAAMGIFAHYARRGKGLINKVTKGKMLFLGGSTAMEPTGQGGFIGDLSGIATQSIRWPLKGRYEPGLEIALVDNWEEKIQRVAERVIDRDITFVTGMPSWVKVLMDRLCTMRGIEAAGSMGKIWPTLQLFVHGGVNFAPYRPTFARYFPPGHPMQTLEVYPASEGFIAIQAQQDQPGMELITDNGIFYEFVPLSEWGKPDAPRLTIGEVELDVPYSIVLTTNAGLWAYDIGDVVRFVSLTPPRIVFAGRNKHFINAFGENIIAENVSAAVAKAAELCDAEIAAYTASPRYPAGEKPGAHTYVVEFAREPAAGIDAFAQTIDDTLQALNVDYSVKRGGDLGMTCVEVAPVPRGTFYEWMKQRGKLGGQNKTPVCANHRDYVDGLLEIAQTISA